MENNTTPNQEEKVAKVITKKVTVTVVKEVKEVVKEIPDEKLNLHDLSTKYAEIVLVLQGGGALGSYQAGVVESLFESNIEPTWIAGISIGALNTAIIAGNKPANRVKALRGFWETICKTNMSSMDLNFLNPFLSMLSLQSRRLVSSYEANKGLMEGQNGFFTPRFPLPLPYVHQKTPDEISYYKTQNLKETLLKYADFDLINKGKIRVSVGAVNIKTGNFVYFDNTKEILRPEHFMASGALPPGFPAVEIDGEYYWDGGIVSNTPLFEVLNKREKKDKLIFQVDLWSARGSLPENFFDVTERSKDIQFSSRTRLVTDMLEEQQKNKIMIKELLKCIPVELQKNNPWCDKAKESNSDGVTNVIQLVYRDKSFEGHCKDFEFSNATMNEHWSSGLTDMRETLKNKIWFKKPSKEKGFVTHDIHRNSKE